jgi:hypothetical protein
MEPIVLTGKAWTAMLHLCKELVDIQQSYFHTQVNSFLLTKNFNALKEKITQYFLHDLHGFKLGDISTTKLHQKVWELWRPKSHFFLSYIAIASTLKTFVVYFLAGYSVLATPLLLSPIFFF